MNFIKKMISLVCALSLALAIVNLSVSAATVTYLDTAEKYVFDTASEESPTDIFENFKNCMPGDTLTQEVTLKNHNNNRMAVRVFLRFTGAEEGSESLLSQLTLTVGEKDKTPFFTAPASSTQSLGDWVELGTLVPGGKIELVCTLSVPIDLGNEFQNAVGKLGWQFKAEEQPIDTIKKYCPNCGEVMDIVPGEDGEDYLVFRCGHCDYDEEMTCDVCGGKMRRVLVLGDDGKYYYYYECIDTEEHHTDPTPVTGDTSHTVLWAAVLCGALIATATIIFFGKKRKKS